MWDGGGWTRSAGGRRQEYLGVNSMGLPEGGAKDESWVSSLYPGWGLL